MKRIVIEITDKLYKALMLGYEEPYSRAFGDCVRSGTLLPKGHGRLIDADAYIEEYGCCGYLEDIEIDYFNTITPTIVESDGGEE